MLDWLFRGYARWVDTRWQKRVLWDMVEPYKRPLSVIPLLTINVAAFYTGVVGAAITEQLYKEKYWEEHPGEAVPLMKPQVLIGRWPVQREDFMEKK